MELKEMKSLWSQMNHSLEAAKFSSELNLTINRSQRLQNRMQPLFMGQKIQLIAGILLVLFSGSFWFDHLQSTALFTAGVALHAYGIAMIALSLVMHIKIHNLAFDKPVLEIQKQLTELKKRYATMSSVLGLSWWVMWVPVLMILFFLAFDLDIYTHSPLVIIVFLGFGFSGLFITLWLYFNTKSNPKMALKIDHIFAGKTIIETEIFLQSMAEFEK